MDNTIIRSSSYLVYEESLTKTSPINSVPGQVDKNSKTVTFYTFDGNPIITIEHKFNFELMKAKLDPFSLPPKPVSYRRVWVPSFQSENSPVIEAGYLVLFHDKNNIRIGWELLNFAEEYIKSWPEYDLSQAFEEESDYSLKNAINIVIIDDYKNTDSKNNVYLDFCRKSTISASTTGSVLTMSIMRLYEKPKDQNEQVQPNIENSYSCSIF
jgi:hypothetical protein